MPHHMYSLSLSLGRQVTQYIFNTYKESKQDIGSKTESKHSSTYV